MLKKKLSVPALIIFAEMRFLLVPENEFFHEIRSDRRTGFMNFMFYLIS